ncbi:MAG: hypothetical protein AAFX87_08955 [Bacteroidota bacterium]
MRTFRTNYKAVVPVALGLLLLTLLPFDKEIYSETGTQMTAVNDTSDANGKRKGEILNFIDAWGKAWSPKDKTATFTMADVSRFYVHDETLLAFDFTDSKQKTVIKGYQAHTQMWAPFVPSFSYWTFTPVSQSIRIFDFGSKGAGVVLYVDNYGIKPDGSEFKARAHATLILVKSEGQWRINHENIWGPVRE